MPLMLLKPLWEGLQVSNKRPLILDLEDINFNAFLHPEKDFDPLLIHHTKQPEHFKFDLESDLKPHKTPSWLKSEVYLYGLDDGPPIDPKPQKVLLYSAPAARIDNILKFLFPKRDYERVLSQTIEDFRTEYFESLHAGNKWQARWIAVRGYGNICLTAVCHVCATVVKRIKGILSII